jgi:glutathione S-transferase
MEPAGEGLTLYYDPLSQPSRAVKTLLLAGKVPHNDKVVSIMKREHKSEEYLKLNAKGLVPFIRDGDFGLAESNAILKYLCNTQDSIPEHFWPKDAKLRAITDQYLEFYSFVFRPTILAPMRTLMATALFGADIPEEVKAFQAAQATQTLEVFEKMLNQHKGAFLVSDQPTIADF